MKSMSVRSLPLHKPIILQKNNSLYQAAMAMNRNQVGSVIVSDGHGGLQGLFTDRDLALTLALHKMPSSVPLSEATHHSLIYASETATLQDIINLMKKHSIRRVPIVKECANGKQKCLGIITLDDLIKERLIDEKDETQIIKSQLRTSKEKMGMGKMKSIFHSQDHKDQSLHKFIKSVGTYTNLSRSNARDLAIETLTLILRRVPAKSGKSLLSQLPTELQMQLLPQISPVDRSITGKLLLTQVQKKFSVKPATAAALLQSFWRSLAQTISLGEIKKLERELPKDMTLLLAPPTTPTSDEIAMQEVRKGG